MRYERTSWLIESHESSSPREARMGSVRPLMSTTNTLHTMAHMRSGLAQLVDNSQTHTHYHTPVINTLPSLTLPHSTPCPTHYSSRTSLFFSYITRHAHMIELPPASPFSSFPFAPVALCSQSGLRRRSSATPCWPRLRTTSRRSSAGARHTRSWATLTAPSATWRLPASWTPRCHTGTERKHVLALGSPGDCSYSSRSVTVANTQLHTASRVHARCILLCSSLTLARALLCFCVATEQDGSEGGAAAHGVSGLGH